MVKNFQLIESSRKNLSVNWSGDHRKWKEDLKILKDEQTKMIDLNGEEKQNFAHCTTCMLELINRCESSYRTCRLRVGRVRIRNKKDHNVVYVLTAHPTEARGPEFLTLFGRISDLLEESLVQGHRDNQQKIYHLLRILLNVPLTRKNKPQVVDEAKSIFSFALRPEILSLLIRIRQEGTNVMLRTWAGGDKDGHPGVDEKTLLESLQLSRSKLLDFITARFDQFESELGLMKNLKFHKKLIDEFGRVVNLKKKLCVLTCKDGKKVFAFRKNLISLLQIMKLWWV